MTLLLALTVVWVVRRSPPPGPATDDRSPPVAEPTLGVRDIDTLLRFLGARAVGLDRMARALDTCVEHPVATGACSRSRHEKVIARQEVALRRAALRRRAEQLIAVAQDARLFHVERRIAMPTLARLPAEPLRLTTIPAREGPRAGIGALAPAVAPLLPPLARLPSPDVPVSAASPGWLADDLALLKPVDGRPLPQLAQGRYGRGLLIEVGHPRPVAAPATGTVRFAGPMPGYGLVLIIEHGSGYHSVLAGLARLDVDEATEVVAGQTVGSITAANGAGRLYVELRRHGAPLNPAAWTAAREDKVAG